tara:strand:+ start:332 stop:646 length:315 start_codon:yes stop_codon:yes gene_type:complete
MIEFIWSSGEKPEKSLKKTHQEESIEEDKSAIVTALNAERGFSDPLISFRQQMKGKNGREDANLKIGERELVGRVSRNPFLSENTYLDDISVEDNLLRPQNTKD